MANSPINWGASERGAEIVDFSSDVPCCNALNIIDDDLSKIWLTDEGLPQWICISVLNLKNPPQDLIIRNVGWHCWHPYTTNPKSVTVHVSSDGSKFKLWDVFSGLQVSGTQLFCCAPINCSVYPYVAFEITETFGGLQTYMNRIYLYSDELVTISEKPIQESQPYEPQIKRRDRSSSTNRSRVSGRSILDYNFDLKSVEDDSFQDELNDLIQSRKASQNLVPKPIIAPAYPKAAIEMKSAAEFNSIPSNQVSHDTIHPPRLRRDPDFDSDSHSNKTSDDDHYSTSDSELSSRGRTGKLHPDAGHRRRRSRPRTSSAGSDRDSPSEANINVNIRRRSSSGDMHDNKDLKSRTIVKDDVSMKYPNYDGTVTSHRHSRSRSCGQPDVRSSESVAELSAPPPTIHTHLIVPSAAPDRPASPAHSLSTVVTLRMAGFELRIGDSRDPESYQLRTYPSIKSPVPTPQTISPIHPEAPSDPVTSAMNQPSTMSPNTDNTQSRTLPHAGQAMDVLLPSPDPTPSPMTTSQTPQGSRTRTVALDPIIMPIQEPIDAQDAGAGLGVSLEADLAPRSPDTVALQSNLAFAGDELSNDDPDPPCHPNPTANSATASASRISNIPQPIEPSTRASPDPFSLRHWINTTEIQHYFGNTIGSTRITPNYTNADIPVLPVSSSNSGSRVITSHPIGVYLNRINRGNQHDKVVIGPEYASGYHAPDSMTKTNPDIAFIPNNSRLDRVLLEPNKPPTTVPGTRGYGVPSPRTRLRRLVHRKATLHHQTSALTWTRSRTTPAYSSTSSYTSVGCREDPSRADVAPPKVHRRDAGRLASDRGALPRHRPHTCSYKSLSEHEDSSVSGMSGSGGGADEEEDDDDNDERPHQKYPLGLQSKYDNKYGERIMLYHKQVNAIDTDRMSQEKAYKLSTQTTHNGSSSDGDGDSYGDDSEGHSQKTDRRTVELEYKSGRGSSSVKRLGRENKASKQASTDEDCGTGDDEDEDDDEDKDEGYCSLAEVESRYPLASDRSQPKLPTAPLVPRLPLDIHSSFKGGCDKRVSVGLDKGGGVIDERKARVEVEESGKSCLSDNSSMARGIDDVNNNDDTAIESDVHAVTEGNTSHFKRNITTIPASVPDSDFGLEDVIVDSAAVLHRCAYPSGESHAGDRDAAPQTPVTRDAQVGTSPISAPTDNLGRVAVIVTDDEQMDVVRQMSHLQRALAEVLDAVRSGPPTGPSSAHPGPIALMPTEGVASQSLPGLLPVTRTRKSLPDTPSYPLPHGTASSHAPYPVSRARQGEATPITGVDRPVLPGLSRGSGRQRFRGSAPEPRQCLTGDLPPSSDIEIPVNTDVLASQSPLLAHHAPVIPSTRVHSTDTHSDTVQPTRARVDVSADPKLSSLVSELYGLVLRRTIRDAQLKVLKRKHTVGYRGSRRPSDPDFIFR